MLSGESLSTETHGKAVTAACRLRDGLNSYQFAIREQLPWNRVRPAPMMRSDQLLFIAFSAEST